MPEATIVSESLSKLLSEYANLITLNGPNSDPVRAMLTEHALNREFIKLAVPYRRIYCLINRVEWKSFRENPTVTRETNTALWHLMQQVGSADGAEIDGFLAQHKDKPVFLRRQEALRDNFRLVHQKR